MIDRFTNEWRCLSNFWPAPVVYEGEVYPTVEHAYQAAKTLDLLERKDIRNLVRPGDAKQYGRKVTMREDWDKIKLDVMLAILRAKFKHHDLKMQLLATEDEELQEGNYWHDTFWGIDLKTGIGYNHLGKLLMQIRTEIRQKKCTN